MPSGRVIEPRARIVAHLLRAELDDEPWDRGGRQGAYDLHLLLPPNGEKAALEVTSHAHRDLIELMVAMNHHGEEISAPTLSYRWSLGLAEDVYRRSKGYRGIKRDVEAVGPSILEALEARGASYFERPEFGSATTDIDPLTRLGIAFGLRSSEPVPAGSIRFWPPEGMEDFGDTGPSVVLEAAKQELEANREKLGRAQTRERHLLVWLDGSVGSVWLGLDEHHTPDKVPTLEPEVTTLWIAGCHRDQPATVVWRVSPQASWETFVVADADLREPASPASS
jgi:hypothetical protein